MPKQKMRFHENASNSIDKEAVNTIIFLSDSDEYNTTLKSHPLILVEINVEMSFPCVFCNAPTIAPWETVEIEGLQKLRKLELTTRKGRKSGKSSRKSVNSLKIKFFTIINSIFDVPAAKINAFIGSYDFSKHSPFCLACHKKSTSLNKLGQEKNSLESSILELQKGLHQKLKRLKNVMDKCDSTLASFGEFIADSIEEDEDVDSDDVVNGISLEAKKKHSKLLDSLRKSMKIRLEREASISSTSKKKASNRNDEKWTDRKMKEAVKNYPKGFVIGKNSTSKNIKKKVDNSVASPKPKSVSSNIEDTIKTDIEYEDFEVKIEYDEMPEFDPADYEPSVDDMNEANLRNFLASNDEIEDKNGPQSTEKADAGGIRRSLRKRKIMEKDEKNDSDSSEEDILGEESSNSGSENGNESDWIEEFASEELEATFKKNKKMKRLLELEPGLLESEALVKEATAQRDTLAKFMEESLRALGDFDSMEEVEGRFRGVYRGIQVDTINSAEEGKCLECESCRHFVKIKGHGAPRDILLASKQIRCHINEKHFGGYVCTNTACTIGKEEQRVYKSLDKFVDHLRRHNKKNCDICGKPVTVEDKGYIKHIWTHKSEEEKQQAIEAGEIPPRPQKINKTRNFLCISCGAAFPTGKTLKQHEESIHLDKKERDKQRIPCDRCGKLLLPVSMASHEKYAHQKKETLRTFACPFCPRTFFNNSILKGHIKKTHTGEGKKFKCTVCPKAFFTQRLLNIHAQTHLDKSQRELFECDQCSAKFTSARNLKRHVDVLHAPNRPQTTTNKRNRKQNSHQQENSSSEEEEGNEEAYFPRYKSFNYAVPGPSAPSSSSQMNSNFELSAVPTFDLSNTHSFPRNNDHQFYQFYNQ